MLMMLRCFSSVPHYIYMTIQQQIQQAHMFMTSTLIEETKQIMQAALFCLWDTSWAPLMASTLVQVREHIRCIEQCGKVQPRFLNYRGLQF